MTRVILWAILILLLLRALRRLMRGVLEGAGYRRGSGPPGVALVKDPICGMFVVPSQALSSGSGRETKFFCSEKCRRAWQAR